MDRIRTWFSEQTIFAPFGRYEGTRKADEPANQVLIGREKQRARFLDLLFSRGRTGALLVTGQRGAGKTSFVRYCLGEYQQDIYRRWLATNVGRTLFWDRIGNLIFCGALPLLLLLLVSELSQIVLQAQRISVFEWILLVLCCLVTVFPILSGLVTLRQLFHSFYLIPKKRPTETSVTALRRRFGLRSALTGVGLIVVLSFLLPSGGVPAVALSQLLYLTAALTLCAAAFCAWPRGEGEPRDPGTWFQVVLQRPRLRSNILLIVSFVVLALPVFLLPGHKIEADAEIAHQAFLYGLAAVFSLGLASCLSAINRKLYEASHVLAKEEGGLGRRPETHGWSFLLAIGFFVPSMVGLCALGSNSEGSIPSAQLFGRSISFAFLLLVLNLIVFGLALFRGWRFGNQRNREKKGVGRYFEVHPPIRSLLALKTCMLVLIGLHLSIPLGVFALKLLEGAHSRWPGFLRSLSEAVQQGLPNSVAAVVFGAVEGASGQIGLFCRGGYYQDVLWVAAGGSLLLLVGALEFSWIVRPGAPVREDASLWQPPKISRDQTSPSREHWEKVARQQLVRDLTEKSFFSLVFGAWLPVLRVPVNLGFDDLDYKRVVDAMLAGLKNQYHFHFLNWRQPVVAAKKLLFLVLLAAFSLGIGSYLFETSSTDTAISESRLLENGEYCDWALRPKSAGISGGERPVPRALWLACRTGGEWLIQILQWRPLSSADNTGPLERVEAREAPWTETCLRLPFLFPTSCSAEGFPYLRLTPLRVDLSANFAAQGSDGSERVGALSDFGLISAVVPFDGHPVRGIRAYHLLTAFLLWLCIRGLARIFPFLSQHRESYRKITDLHEHLSSSIREELPPEVAGPVSFAASLFRHKVRQKTMDPLDPRTVEVRFLGLLEELHDRELRLPFARQHLISIPAPDVIFVFDELDKIGVGRILVPVEPATDPAREAAAPMIQGRERAKQLHLLFGDLKNLLSSARSRFIFLGARNLHDESLADYTDRNPLLSNIFDEDIYLPSLLSDSSYDFRQQVEDPFIKRRKSSRSSYGLQEYMDSKRYEALHDLPIQDHYLEPIGIEHFLRVNLKRSEDLLAAYQRKSTISWLMPWTEDRKSSAYVRDGLHWLAARRSDSENYLELRSEEHGDELHAANSIPFQREFLQFLAYRSLGNVKRLRSLLESFILPVGHVYRERMAQVNDVVEQTRTPRGWRAENCAHVLEFSDVARFRVQLISSIYRELLPALEDKISDGDDKLVIGILYLSDFVLKFHRRGFTWSNLGRLDELVHIHRPPELRRIIEQVVVAWSDRFLHPIRNGMYDYRFESSFSRELAYISARSERELAAFNFTLDESQALKAIFQARLKALAGEESQDFIAGLGELHEFDEEYEMARYQYRRAVRRLDQQFYVHPPEDLSGKKKEHAFVGVYEALRGSLGSGSESIRLQISWGISRIRLMLQIAMSFEQSKDLEQARTEYRNARTLATAVLEAMTQEPDLTDKSSRDYVMTVKHLNLIFQPTFAEAWVSEKMVAGIDTASALLERALEEFRRMLPPSVHRENLIRDLCAESPEGIRHMNFALSLAELHDKVGDLYFFKGRQAPQPGDLGDCHGSVPKRREGYLTRAYYHYSSALQEIRRYNRYRVQSSAFKVNNAQGERWPTHKETAWPDFSLRTAAGAFADLADCLVARISLRGLLRNLAREDQVAPTAVSIHSSLLDTYRHLDAWLEESSIFNSSEAKEKEGRVLLKLGSMLPGVRPDPEPVSNWLGLFVSRKSKEGADAVEAWDVQFSMKHTDLERLSASMAFCLYSAQLLERAGYQEAAARECLRSVQTILSFLWWILYSTVLDRRAEVDEARVWREDFDVASFPPLRSPSVVALVRLARLSLTKAAELFSKGRAWGWSGGQRPRIPVGEDVPPRVVTTICSFGLCLTTIAEQTGDDGVFVEEHGELIGTLGRIWPSWCRAAVNLSWSVKTGGGVLQKLKESLKAPASNSKEIEKEIRFRLPSFYCAALAQNIAEHSYPLRDRLLGLHALISHSAVGKTRGLLSSGEDEAGRVKNLWRETGPHVIEFLKLKKLYSSPLHFSPTYSGLALSMLGLRLSDDQNKEFKKEVERAGISLQTILRVAQQDLVLGQELTSMRRGYYESISDLYYLYDDFNDRAIHHNQAIQIAAGELSAYCLALIRTKIIRP